MPRKVARKERGVFEKQPGSGIWWIRYKIDGIERREKVGRRGDAIRLYQVRRADALRGVKLPPTVDLRTVQELAGHKTISMTVRYAHLAPEHNQAAIEKLDPAA